MRHLVRENILNMQGYAPGEQPQDIEKWIKLNTNENAYAPSPKCLETLKNFSLDALRRYPNPTADHLRDTIGERLGFERHEILVGNGSDDILNIVMRTYANTQDEVAMVVPSYSLYNVLAEIQGVKCRTIALQSDFTLPNDFVGQMQGIKLLFIPSPNAPTGLPFPKETLRQIVKAVDAMVLIDEAYVDFAKENALDFVKTLPNVLISRTFSKSYALAGLRVGFVISQRINIEQLFKVKDSYNVGALPQAIAQAAMEDQPYLVATVKKIVDERERVNAELQKLGFTTIPSATNFIFTRPPDGDGKRCYDYLKKCYILVRYFPSPQTSSYIRITIGTPTQMNTLLTALKTY